MLSEQEHSALMNAWKYWQKEKDYIVYFGFKDWLKEEYGVTYTNNEIKFHTTQGRVLFWMRWA